ARRRRLPGDAEYPLAGLSCRPTLASADGRPATPCFHASLPTAARAVFHGAWLPCAGRSRRVGSGLAGQAGAAFCGPGHGCDRCFGSLGPSGIRPFVRYADLALRGGKEARMSSQSSRPTPGSLIILPVLNEEVHVRPLLSGIARELAGVSHDILFIDDGSRDNTVALLRQATKTNRR